MHTCTEIILPPTDDVSGAVSEILKPYDINSVPDSEAAHIRPFWDHWSLADHNNGKAESVYRYGEVLDFECFRLIYAHLEDHAAFCGYFDAANPEGYPPKLCVQFMLVYEFWNGVNWQTSKWDGSFLEANKLFDAAASKVADTRYPMHKPNEDWLVVTVDTHC